MLYFVKQTKVVNQTLKGALYRVEIIFNMISKYLIMLMIFCVQSGWCDRCIHDIGFNSHGIISNRTYQV